MILSIVVLSYNRPTQVERILKNLVGVASSEFNLIIKDDVSPLHKEINSVVEHYKSKLGFDVQLYSNEVNMGYDRNLLDAFNVTSSEYVFLLSDDDYIDGKKLNELIQVLSKREKKIYFTPYLENGIIRRANINEAFKLTKFSDVVYNSILFSGLVLHRQTVLNLPKDFSFLSNCIYTQVYLTCVIIFHEEDFGFAPENLLYLGGDGENYFGKNSSAQNSGLLIDRNQILSDFNYQQFLIRVVHKVSIDTSSLVYKSFLSEYRKRLVAYALRSRAAGLKGYISFLSGYASSEIGGGLFLSFIFIILFFLPSFITNKLYIFLKNNFKKSG